MIRFLVSLVCLIAAGGVAVGAAPSASAQDEPAAIIATFEVADEQFRVRIENPDTIAQVLALERGESDATIPNGVLRRGTDVNEPWSWHLDPHEIELAEITIELCDGRPSFVEEDLDYWVDVVGRYCPWNAVLVSVEEIGETTPAPEATPSPTEGPAASPTPLPGLPDTGGGSETGGATAQILIAAGLAAAAALAGGALLLRSRRA